MNKIIIIRHAQAHDISTWFSHDFYRTLTKDWVTKAKKTWKELFDMWIKPDILITSAAPRSYQTALIISNILKIKYNQIISDTNLYRCGIEKRLDTLGYFGDKKTILVVWHNPELLSLCNYFSKEKIQELKKWSYYEFIIDSRIKS